MKLMKEIKQKVIMKNNKNIKAKKLEQFSQIKI